ncbi:predicted protein [Plenodomus lingam JN3]|uniref:Predicted protein n=1 Tax=Leptosphaeria maculans (strain JN3 / isolate v23.1.3 / race Av1-4-5-6-7-8) TaxID=985895 RepID=E5R4Z8_LEPMJ|nr:predicted protein [Plenodomus lingam JN3]CBX92271.1 predicted protein [Plenodomus lingam JN3]
MGTSGVEFHSAELDPEIVGLGNDGHGTSFNTLTSRHFRKTTPDIEQVLAVRIAQDKPSSICT